MHLSLHTNKLFHFLCNFWWVMFMFLSGYGDSLLLTVATSTYPAFMRPMCSALPTLKCFYSSQQCEII